MSRQGQAPTRNDGGIDMVKDEDLLDITLNQGTLKQNLILRFSCANLPDLDKNWGSKSDPFIVLWSLDKGQKKLVGQTECIKDNLNPEFMEGIDVTFFFEENQKFEVEVYDADDLTQLKNLKKQTLMGSKEFTLHSLVTKPNQKLTEKLKKGEITIKAEEKPQQFGQTTC